MAWVGPMVQGINSWKQHAFNKEYQSRELNNQIMFQKDSLGWKVAAAQAVGIHPLAAIGANVTPYRPASVGGQPFTQSGLGESISRAIRSQQTSEEKRLLQLAAEEKEAEIKGLNHNNRLLEIEINKRTQEPIPIPSVNQETGALTGQHSRVYEVESSPATRSEGTILGHQGQEQVIIDKEGWAKFANQEKVAEMLEEAGYVDKFENNMDKIYNAYRRARKDKNFARIMYKSLPPAGKGMKWFYYPGIGRWRKLSTQNMIPSKRMKRIPIPKQRKLSRAVRHPWGTY